MPLVIAGATSGSTTVQATDAVTATITLPSATNTLATLAGSETLTNKALNGTLGATTPSTVVATTISGGLISSSVGATTTNALNINATTAGYGAVITHQTGGVTKYSAGLNVFTGTGEWGIYDNAAALLRFNIASTGIISMPVYGAGAATFSAAGVISSVSDETWKIKDGVPLNPSEMLQKLEPGYWYYNDEKKELFGSERQLGFYAQNVNKAIGVEAAPIPETYIKTDENGVETTQTKPWGYYDRSVLAVVVMALKEQQQTIAELSAKITLLEK